MIDSVWLILDKKLFQVEIEVSETVLKGLTTIHTVSLFLKTLKTEAFWKKVSQISNFIIF